MSRSAMSGLLARFSDGMLCTLLNRVHALGRGGPISREALERYIEGWEGRTREQYYALDGDGFGSFEHTAPMHRWKAPVATGFTESDHAFTEYFPGPKGPAAPTLIVLHALMSFSPVGYRKLAAKFNAAGWNAAFVHLPYHYSRRPRGYLNGELCISRDFVRTGEAIRSAVVELRQLMQGLRARGCTEFGLFATSYGAWIGSLLASVEECWRFIVLMTPIEELSGLIWEGPATQGLRRQLRRVGIDEPLVARHNGLVSPRFGRPLCDPDRIWLLAGSHDRICPSYRVKRLADSWGGVHYEEAAQGHFGHQLLSMAYSTICASGLLDAGQKVR